MARSTVAPSTAARSRAATSSPPRRPSEGRARLLDTAERLFAERGVTGVSLREVTEAAGQRNASVVQYHFGSRAGLVAAIVDRHMAAVDADRTARLDALAPGAPADVHAVMRILVEPLADRLRTASGRYYLRVLQHLVDLPLGPDQEQTPLSASNPSLVRTTAMLAEANRDMPAAIRAERHAQTTSFLLRALADRASATDGPGPKGRGMDHPLFVANLVDVLVAVLTAPPSDATRSLSATRRRTSFPI